MTGECRGFLTHRHLYLASILRVHSLLAWLARTAAVASNTHLDSASKFPFEEASIAEPSRLKTACALMEPLRSLGTASRFTVN